MCILEGGFHVLFGMPSALPHSVMIASLLAVVNKGYWERLDVRPVRRQRFRIASGEVIESDVGDALVRLEDVEGATPVIFNEPGEPTLLGAVTLEAFLLGVDPVSQRPIPVEGLRVSRRSL